MDNLEHDWPDFAIEDKFDWSLSYKELSHKYTPKKVVAKPANKVVPKSPKIIPEKPVHVETPTLSLHEFIDKLNKEPEMNFHYDD